MSTHSVQWSQPGRLWYKSGAQMRVFVLADTTPTAGRCGQTFICDV